MKMYLYPVLTEPNKHPNLPIGERPGQWIVHAPVHPTPSRWKDRRQAGFTLIELLVVLGVIALLASLILPALAMAKSSAQTAKCKSNIRQVGLGLKIYTDQEGELPPFHDCMARSGTNWWSSFLRPYTSSSWLDLLYQCPAY